MSKKILIDVEGHIEGREVESNLINAHLLLELLNVRETDETDSRDDEDDREGEGDGDRLAVGS